MATLGKFQLRPVAPVVVDAFQVEVGTPLGDTYPSLVGMWIVVETGEVLDDIAFQAAYQPV